MLAQNSWNSTVNWSSCLTWISLCEAETHPSFRAVIAVSEDTLNKNLSAMAKSVKQLQIDVKNAQNDKTAPPNDAFVSVMGDFLNTAKVTTPPCWHGNVAAKLAW